MKDIDYLKKTSDYISSGKAEKKEVDELRERLRHELEPKVDLHEVQTALTAC